MLSIEEFSGGGNGIPSGACGLLTAMGKNINLEKIVKGGGCLQYRGRAGAGITLKGVYATDSHYFNFHIMYRDSQKILEHEQILESWGIHIIDRGDLVKRNIYYDYDMPVMIRYTIVPPSVEEMLYKEKISDPLLFTEKKVTEFNILYKDDARIFSSGTDAGTFLTAFDLVDTVRIFDIPQYADRGISIVQMHMRWPTSTGRGLWWGPQPIALGKVSGTHNGHLSSDKSNASALEQLGIYLHVGTDSEAIFQETNYLLRKGFSLKEIEWILSPKFPQEAALLNDAEKERYFELTTDPILRRFKMSGPSTAIILIDDIVIGITDRDHLRPFAAGFNDEIALLGSEERAILTTASMLKQDVETFNPEAGRVVAFMLIDGKPRRLSNEWRLYQ